MKKLTPFASFLVSAILHGVILYGVIFTQWFTWRSSTKVPVGQRSVIIVDVLETRIYEDAPEQPAGNRKFKQTKPAASRKIQTKDSALKGFVETSYPLLSVQNQEQGDVTLSIAFDKLGKVHKVNVIQSSGFMRLDQAAMESAQQLVLPDSVKKYFIEENKTLKIQYALKIEKELHPK